MSSASASRLPKLDAAGKTNAGHRRCVARRTFGKDFDKLLRDLNGAVAA